MSQDTNPKTLKPHDEGKTAAFRSTTAGTELRVSWPRLDAVFTSILQPTPRDELLTLPDGRTIPITVGRIGDYPGDAVANAALKVGPHGVYAANAGRTLTDMCHGPAKAAGWWTDLATGEALTIDTPRLVSEKLCLVHSEISEAMEGHRKGLMDDKLPRRSMLEVELADAAIRIFDMAGGFGLDVAGAIAEKLAYNKTRTDHQLANRRADSGKKF